MGDFFMNYDIENNNNDYDLIKNEYNKVYGDTTHFSKQEDFELFLDNIDKKK